MLKVFKKQDIAERLLKKNREIVITNVCNLNCGGCCQLVGQFQKDQLWFITLEELEINIKILKKYPPKNSPMSPITIFGGEPTLHPEWDRIIKILKKHAPTNFWINTNGRLGHKRYQKEDNIVWYVDRHPDNQLFVQTSYAAMDAIKLPSDIDYWKKAQKDCPIWNGCQCSIYNNKAYFCENAAAIDWLFNNGNNGWDLSDNKNPFDRSKEEIDKQASQLCKRCGWCAPELIPRQLSRDPTYVSPSNQIKGKIKNILPVINIQKPQRWDTEQVSCESLNIGIYRISDCPVKNEIEKGIVIYNEKYKKVALEKGRSKHEWTIVLDKDHIIPKYSLVTIFNWIIKEKTKSNPRLHFSIPVYEVSKEKIDSEMLEPNFIQTVSLGVCKNSVKSIVVAFHKNSKENYDNNLLKRLGHRRSSEGSGLASLWHDELTDIVGGVIKVV